MNIKQLFVKVIPIVSSGYLLNKGTKLFKNRSIFQNRNLSQDDEIGELTKEEKKFLEEEKENFDNLTDHYKNLDLTLVNLSELNNVELKKLYSDKKEVALYLNFNFFDFNKNGTMFGKVIIVDSKNFKTENVFFDYIEEKIHAERLYTGSRGNVARVYDNKIVNIPYRNEKHLNEILNLSKYE